ncbi:MAG: DUF3696 domain-containing protein [Nitrospirae bacterium]|uniref:AAA family ATPase n=1 Tax=Candidatus Magnetobacterium casense TaxID=1455061 RepID=UPI00058FB0BB|nr:DUF3696 domain-containing protein [Candidatus Magnetobacterium casensis]MBF0336865.1 DUF3696 domain-containing protein [Nitrospirota bacterium]
MLTEISLSNFKSFPGKTLPLLPMTLLTGLNSSGKSTVLQAIRMLWKWATDGEPTLQEHGTLKDMKSIKAAVSDPMQIACVLKNGESIEMNVKFTTLTQTEIIPCEPVKSKMPFMSYISADRWGPRVFLPMHNAAGDLIDVGQHGEHVIDFLWRHEGDIIPQQLSHPDSEGTTLSYNVRAWLKEISPYTEFKYNVDHRRDVSYAEINDFRPTNTGFGLSYTLPVIVALLGMSAEWNDKEKQTLKETNGAIVLLENPEAHLHPKAQTAIGRLIALAAASGVEVIVETHSEHLMDGIRIAIKEGVLSCDMAKFYYFSVDKDGTTIVEEPNIYTNGELDYWPEGFFDQTMHNTAILARE